MPLFLKKSWYCAFSVWYIYFSGGWPSVFVTRTWEVTASDTFLSAVWRTSSSAAPGLAPDAHLPPALCSGEERRVAGLFTRLMCWCIFHHPSISDTWCNTHDFSLHPIHRGLYSAVSPAYLQWFYKVESKVEMIKLGSPNELCTDC